ncbi:MULTISPECIES: 3-methyladenine DNA glycosylase [Bacillus]|uniref:3-methyladenine DNA glycosylase n=1 Tax=Bacillus capparidis TaxID=1840411 RepID=A0ABS4CXQ8_9BACI|nr:MULTISPECIES: 3-methyladenine DNA glycosylase [Bacillus]MBP1081987.1 hypothetical protein [Bacillus capparidis]MED1096622.1 3-methyladenine DNA glycosylase [Bacillus capparidis]
MSEKNPDKQNDSIEQKKKEQQNDDIEPQRDPSEQESESTEDNQDK